MNKKLNVPRFQLQKIYADGSREEPELHALNGIDAACRMGRRGFLLTSAIGAGALAALYLSGEARAAEEKTAIPHVEIPDVKGIPAHTGWIHSLAFNPDGKCLASAGKDGAIKLWSVPEGKAVRIIKADNSPVLAVSFSKDGQRLLSGSADGTVMLRRSSSSEEEKTLARIDQKTLCYAFSPNAKFFAASLGNEIQIRSLADGALVATLNQTKNIYDLVFTPDGKKLVSTSPTLWEVPSGKHLLSWSGNASQLAINSSQMLASSTMGGGIELRILPSGKFIRRIMYNTLNLSVMAFSPNGKLLAVSCGRHTIALLADPFEAPMLELGGHGDFVSALAFSKEGRYLAAGTRSGGLYLWEIREGGVRLQGVFFDPEITNADVSVVQAQRTDGTIHTAPCGSPLPEGAVCTCNCVSGKYSPPPQPHTTTPAPSMAPPGRGFGGGCRCNTICTCVPVK